MLLSPEDSGKREEDKRSSRSGTEASRSGAEADIGNEETTGAAGRFACGCKAGGARAEARW